MKTWKHFLAVTAAATALMSGAAFAQSAPQNTPWQYGQNQPQQVQQNQPQTQNDRNRQQPNAAQPSNKQQAPKDNISCGCNSVVEYELPKPIRLFFCLF